MSTEVKFPFVYALIFGLSVLPTTMAAQLPKAGIGSRASIYPLRYGLSVRRTLDPSAHARYEPRLVFTYYGRRRSAWSLVGGPMLEPSQLRKNYDLRVWGAELGLDYSYRAIQRRRWELLLRGMASAGYGAATILSIRRIDAPSIGDEVYRTLPNDVDAAHLSFGASPVISLIAGRRLHFEAMPTLLLRRSQTRADFSGDEATFLLGGWLSGYGGPGGSTRNCTGSWLDLPCPRTELNEAATNVFVRFHLVAVYRFGRR